MARQLFLTLATTRHPPPATTAHAADAVRRWLARAQARLPELVLDNGSGLSRQRTHRRAEHRAAAARRRRSRVRDEFASSLAVAATDGTVEQALPERRRRRPGAAQDRHAGRRARDRRLRDRCRRQRRWIVVASSTTRMRRARSPRSTCWCSGSTPRRSADAEVNALRATSHAGDRLAVLEQQVAAHQAIDHPDRRRDPDAEGDRDADQDEAEQRSESAGRAMPTGTTTRTCGSATVSATRPTCPRASPRLT